jgi:hypothetical protein
MGAMTMLVLDEVEAQILWKILKKGRICPRHIDVLSVLSIFPTHKRGEAKEALRKLVRARVVSFYKAQGREDVCISRKTRRDIEIALEPWLKQWCEGQW